MGTWFARWYDTLMKPIERKAFQTIRKTLMGKAEGKVLELGSGTGINFPYYESADEVIAIEPNELMREKSYVRAQSSRLPIQILPAQAEELPFPDHTFDTVVGTLVLCTVADPVKALAEIRRVSKPEGRVLLFEHVRINDSILGSLQDWLTPMWKRLCDGCHLNRNTLESVKRAGFKVVRIRKYYKNIFIVVEAINRT